MAKNVGKSGFVLPGNGMAFNAQIVPEWGAASWTAQTSFQRHERERR